MASRQLTARYDLALKPSSLSVAQFTLLRRLDRLGQAAVTTLAAALYLERSTAGRNMRVLEKHGLVQRRVGEDQRERIFELTPLGRDALAEAVPLWRAAQKQLESDMGRERALQLRELAHSLG
jgi:DNA-binding MarR family transcriptional regulator